MTRLDSNQQPVGALGVHAVKMPGQKKFHLLKPHSIGTVYCGAGSRGSGDSRWLEVDQVVQSQRCQVCWVNLPSVERLAAVPLEADPLPWGPVDG